MWMFLSFKEVMHRIKLIFGVSMCGVKVRLWLEEVLWEKKYNVDVYRCKGVLRVLNSDQLHTLQVMFPIITMIT